MISFQTLICLNIDACRRYLFSLGGRNHMDGSIDEIIIGQSAAIKELKKLIAYRRRAGQCACSWRDRNRQGAGGACRPCGIREARQAGVCQLCSRSSELLESELFGHEKGAFTGAEKPRKGRVEMANGGTLFLDEIGDMPLSLQSKLLRVLESRTIQPVGGNDEREVDFRLVCATHQNIQDAVNEGTFRADLFFRINVFPLQVPTLAERHVDVSSPGPFSTNWRMI